MATNERSELMDELQAALVDDEDFLKEIVRVACQRIMEEEMTGFLKAEAHERTDERAGYRNGYKPRILRTRVGQLNLMVPKDREGRFSTRLFNRYQRNEKALVLALQEMYLQGVSTRKVAEVTEALCGTSFSKSQVSSLSQELDAEISHWRRRPLIGEYPYIIVDCLYEKVRINHGVVSQGILIVKGINQEGRREILSVDVADTESETTWSSVFKQLKERGLAGVRLVVSDDHLGLVKAARRYFQGAKWQRCQFHFMRNILDMAPKKDRKTMALELKTVFDSPDLDRALKRLSEVAEQYKDRYPKVAEKITEEAEDTLACFSFPAAHRKRVRTTNSLERFNEEIRRRTRVIRIFPNPEAAVRLISALAIEQTEEWITGRCYLNMEELIEAEGGRQPGLEESKVVELS